MVCLTDTGVLALTPDQMKPMFSLAQAWVYIVE